MNRKQAEAVTDKIELAHNISKKYLDGEQFRPETMLERMEQDLQALQTNLIDIGRCGLALKEFLGHGEFMKVIRERFENPGICSLRLVEYCISAAKLYISLPKNAQRAYLQLNKSQQKMLAAAYEDGDYKEDGTIFGITLSEAKSLTIAGLKRELDAYKQKASKDGATIREGRDQLAKAKQELREVRDGRSVGRKSEADAIAAITNCKDVVFGAVEACLDRYDPNRQSPVVNAEVDAMLGACCNFIEDLAVKIRQARDSGVSLAQIRKDALDATDADSLREGSAIEA